MCGYNYNRQLGRHFTTNLLLDINGNQIYEKDSRYRNKKIEKSGLNDMEEEQIEEQIVPAIRNGLNIKFKFKGDGFSPGIRANIPRVIIRDKCGILKLFFLNLFSKENSIMTK